MPVLANLQPIPASENRKSFLIQVVKNTISTIHYDLFYQYEYKKTVKTCSNANATHDLNRHGATFAFVLLFWLIPGWS